MPEIYLKLKERKLDWEPLSRTADPEGATEEEIESNWVGCDGYGVLKKEMYRYCCGLIRGQSFLVAGHRGAGKTLLTHLAIQINRWKVLGKFGPNVGTPPKAFPILVPIHGPDLLRASYPYPESGGEDKLATHAMEQILLALQRAYRETLIQLFEDCFEKEVARGQDLAELNRELHSASTASSAFRFWERFAIDKVGILGRIPDVPVGLGATAGGSQAHQEVLVLELLNHCSETLHSDAQSKPIKVESKDGNPIQFDMKRLAGYWRIIVPILSVAAAVFAASKIPATSDRLVQLLLPAVVFFSTIAITRRMLFRDEQGFPEASLVDGRSLADLDRALPMLVSRMHQNGYAPIFVVDELDKVPEVARRLKGFMRQLKYFATDEAFFCFLTDRSYLETFEAELEHHHYPEEQTYYGHRVLIHYTPEFINRYVKDLFEPTCQIRLDAETLLIRELVQFNSHCHPEEVRQFLNQGISTARPNDIRINEGSLWLVPGYRFTLYSNAILKFLYESSQCKHRLRQDKQFGSWVLDALYYFPQRWLQTGVQFTENDLIRYLAGQLGVKPSQMAEQPTESGILSKSELDFLMALARKFGEYLERPWIFTAAFVKRAARDKAEGPFLAIELVISMLQRPLLVETTAESRKWEFDSFGTPIGKTRDQIQSRYFRAICAKGFQKTLAYCHRDVRLVRRQLRKNGVSTKRLAELVQKHAWEGKFDFVRDLVESHKHLLNQFDSSIVLRTLYETAALADCLYPVERGGFLMMALSDRAATAPLPSTDLEKDRLFREVIGKFSLLKELPEKDLALVCLSISSGTNLSENFKGLNSLALAPFKEPNDAKIP